MWGTYLKMNPYFVKKASAFSIEAFAEIINMKCNDDYEMRDLVTIQTSIYSSLRIKDMKNVKDRMVTITPVAQRAKDKKLLVFGKYFYVMLQKCNSQSQQKQFQPQII